MVTREQNNIRRQNTHFQLQGLDEYSDEYAIQIAINTARRLLKVDDITPKQIIALGKALYALENMPKSTPDIFIEFGLSIDTPNEVRYLTFLISSDVFCNSISSCSESQTKHRPSIKYYPSSRGCLSALHVNRSYAANLTL